MTRTRSPSGAPGEGPLPSQSTIRCYLSWHAVCFFPGPLTVNALHGRDLPCHLAHKKESKPPATRIYSSYFSISLVPGNSVSGRAPNLGRSPPPHSPFHSVPIQAPDVRFLARYQQLVWLVPLVRSFPVVCLPCTARQHRQVRKQPWKAGSSIERAFLFQEVTAAVVVPAIRRAHIKHATPHPHTRQGYARLHARPRLPVGPRIAIPACGLECTRDRPGTFSQRLNVPAH